LTKNSRLLLLLISFFLIFGCAKDRDEMEFRVKPELLAERFQSESLGFSFSPPKGCRELPDSLAMPLAEQLKSQISAAQNISVVPVKFFVNEEDMFICILSELKNFQANEDAIEQYQQMIRQTAKNDKIQQTRYRYHKFQIYQSLVMSDEMVQFKLFFPRKNEPSFQLDYVVPKATYVKYMEAIESSIGSIQK